MSLAEIENKMYNSKNIDALKIKIRMVVFSRETLERCMSGGRLMVLVKEEETLALLELK